MHKFPIAQYRKYSELPMEKLNTFNFSVYVIDFNWNYLFVNDFVKKNLGPRGENLIGKNMWTEFKELANDPNFSLLRANMERRVPTNLVTVSPVTSRRLNITGYPMDDCLYFASSILPDKDDLMQELRNELKKNRR